MDANSDPAKDLNHAAYVRTSTNEQNPQHQRESIDGWLDERDATVEPGDWYVDLGASGTDDDREAFNALMDAIEAGEYTHVVCWEISRISRTGATLQRFFDACEAHDTTVIITDGAVEKVTPDGQGRFVADVIGMVYQQERRTLVRRIESGVRQARAEGKWVGQVPLGFTTNGDGYLRPLLDPGEDEAGYLEVRDAVARVARGESFRSAARGAAFTRQALSNICRDEERRRWYLDADADDDRVAAALEGVPPADFDPDTVDASTGADADRTVPDRVADELDELKARLDRLEAETRDAGS